MQEKPRGYVRIAYLPEQFDGFGILSAVEFQVSCGNPANGLRLPAKVHHPRIVDCFAQSARTLEVKGQQTKPRFSRVKKPRRVPILLCPLSCSPRKFQHFSKFTKAQESQSLST